MGLIMGYAGYYEPMNMKLHQLSKFIGGNLSR